MKTFFASAERALTPQLMNDYNQFNNSEWISGFVNAMPDIVAILNKERQIIFGNDILMKQLGISNQQEMVGLRPGEALVCVNASKSASGCGTTENCRYCGAVNSIVESQITHEKVTKECRIIANKNGINEYLDLKITTAPLKYAGNDFSILSVEDITDTKRRDVLEKLFFHDILNIVGSLKGISDLLVRTSGDNQTSFKYIGIVNDLSKELLEEILSQRLMLSAENNELIVAFELANTYDLLNDPFNYLTHHKIAENKLILINPDAAAFQIFTDVTIVKRVLINLLKNALEASAIGNTITMNCQKLADKVIFSVHNPGHMPDHVKAQIFQRSFSTKGKGRGLGTYSIKLLTERYLKGMVGFTSSEELGTEFFIQIPCGQ